MNKATHKYLSTYAEPEARFAEHITGKYGVCLTLPVLGESKHLFLGLEAALRNAPGKALVIVVVNAREMSTSLQQQDNAALMEHVLTLGPCISIATAPRMTLVQARSADLLLIDRSSPGFWFPEKQGVGLARRIGCDFGLALYAQGGLESPWLWTSDGDVTLPDDYFASSTELHPMVAARLYPFWHEATGAEAIDRATADYEAWLRYYVLGLAWAGSPYAYHSLGSSIAVHADAYASVRGFPKRDAAEDFYLLDKLAKVAPLERLRSPRIRIAARSSRRVPFGTGARVSSLVSTGSILDFYDPRVFEALRCLLSALGRSVNSADPDCFDRSLEQLPAALALPVSSAVHALRIREALETSRDSNDPKVRLRCIHTWLDAFRTLKFIHLLEAQGLSRQAWAEVAARAPFLSGLSGEARNQASSARAQLWEMEQSLPALVGPSLVRDP